VELTLGQNPVCSWVLVTGIMDELILGVDIQHTYDAFMDLGCHILRLGKEEISLWSPQPCGGQ
jgi:hypothetical protein